MLAMSSVRPSKYWRQVMLVRMYIALPVFVGESSAIGTNSKLPKKFAKSFLYVTPFQGSLISN